MQTVRVEWEGPLPLYKARRLNDGPGLYQFYGRHVIFGEGVLLYIGKTGKTFGERVKGNYADWKLGTPWYQDDKEVSVRVGRLYYEGDVFFPQLLTDVESFQIFCHSPPYNGTNISSYSGQSLVIENVGERGDLREQLSTAELNDSGVNLGEEATYVLEIVRISIKRTMRRVIQSEVFKAANKKSHFVQLQASNEVLHEELKVLFEKICWETDGDVSYKIASLGEADQLLLTIKPFSNAQLIVPYRGLEGHVDLI